MLWQVNNHIDRGNIILIANNWITIWLRAILLCMLFVRRWFRSTHLWYNILHYTHRSPVSHQVKLTWFSYLSNFVVSQSMCVDVLNRIYVCVGAHQFKVMVCGSFPISDSSVPDDTCANDDRGSWVVCTKLTDDWPLEEAPIVFLSYIQANHFYIIYLCALLYVPLHCHHESLSGNYLFKMNPSISLVGTVS